MIILKIFLFLIMFLVFLLLILLAMPIHYRILASKGEATILKTEIFLPLKWLHFLFHGCLGQESRLDLRIFGIRINPWRKSDTGRKKTGEGKTEKEKKTKEKKKSRKIKDIRRLIQNILDVAKGFFKHMSPKRFEVKGSYGFDDPYYTGITCATLNIIAPYWINFKTDLNPVFDTPILEGSVIIEGYLIPGFLILLVAKVFLMDALKGLFDTVFKGISKRTIPVK